MSAIIQAQKKTQPADKRPLGLMVGCVGAVVRAITSAVNTYLPPGQLLGAFFVHAEYCRRTRLACRFSPQMSELFEQFEETPLGAASLAQVHRAVLRDGRTVAVKVQHPKVRKQSSRDIMIMEVGEG